MSRIISEINLSDDGELVRITMSDGTKLRISSYDWYGLESKVKKGEIDENVYQHLLFVEECNRAKYKLLSLLSYSGNSRMGFEKKLKKYGFSDESIEKALDFAEEKKLIDDYIYAESLAYELVEVKHYGPIRVKNEMFRHGVDAETTQLVTAKYDLPDQNGLSEYDRNMYKTALEKADGIDFSDRSKREKFFAALNRAGYEYGRISKIKFRKKTQ